MLEIVSMQKMMLVQQTYSIGKKQKMKLAVFLPGKNVISLSKCPRNILTYPAAGLSVLNGKTWNESTVVNGNAKYDDDGGNSESNSKVSWKVKSCCKVLVIAVMLYYVSYMAPPIQLEGK